MNEISKNARVAGFIYVLLGLSAPLRLMYIPGELFVKGDATATAANITANEMLFRLGLVDTFVGVIMLVLGLALYRLFQHVDKVQAALLVIFGALMVTPIYFLNALNDAAVLILLSGADFLAPFTKAQLDAAAMFFLRLHHHGVLVNEVFWGLWLFPFGTLIWKSGFFPRVLAVLLYANGVAYLAQSVTGLLWPAYANQVAGYLFPALLGEVVVMLWMLIRGPSPQRATAPAL